LKISGFISYSHHDAKIVTHDLRVYLEHLLPNFQLIYDENVPEGERIERIKEKLSLCKIFILIITPASIKSLAITEEIDIAKKQDMKIIPCKDKYVIPKWEDLPWDISQYKGIDFSDNDELKKKLVHSLSKLLDDLEYEVIPLKTGIETSIEFRHGTMPLVLQTDKSVYMYNTDMICTIINTEKTNTNPINLMIFNPRKELVYKNSVPIDPSGNGIYQEIIRIGGEKWTRERGTQYLIVAEHNGRTAKLVFLLSDFGMTIELDKKIYTWTDRVRITVIAPDLVHDRDKIERIGNNSKSSIEIKTTKGKLENYELVETGPGTGIFIGEIVLTGFSGYSPLNTNEMDKNMGATFGSGPNRGRIATDNSDGIVITLKTPYETVSSAALIRWNMGEVQWMKSEYQIGDTGMFVLIDPDMNLNPDLIDIFKLMVWSDSDPVGTEIAVIETGTETGIFSGSVQFGTETYEGISIKVKHGDRVCVEYIDKTLPSPYVKGNSLKITGNAVIL
jgi:hypothetical protein